MRHIHDPYVRHVYVPHVIRVTTTCRKDASFPHFASPLHTADHALSFHKSLAYSRPCTADIANTEKHIVILYLGAVTLTADSDPRLQQDQESSRSTSCFLDSAATLIGL